MAAPKTDVEHGPAQKKGDSDRSKAGYSDYERGHHETCLTVWAVLMLVGSAIGLAWNVFGPGVNTSDVINAIWGIAFAVIILVGTVTRSRYCLTFCFVLSLIGVVFRMSFLVFIVLVHTRIIDFGGPVMDDDMLFAFTVVVILLMILVTALLAILIHRAKKNL